VIEAGSAAIPGEAAAVEMRKEGAAPEKNRKSAAGAAGVMMLAAGSWHGSSAHGASRISDEPSVMKSNLTSAIRHGLSALPALGSFLLAKGWLATGDAAQLDQAQSNVIPVIAAVLAALVTRLLMFAIAKYAPALQGLFGASGFSDPKSADQENGDGYSRLLIAGTGLAISLLAGGGALTSCSPTARANMPPMTFAANYHGVSGAYSSKGGLVVAADLDVLLKKRKAVVTGDK
jgi:hypothetical protein